MPKDLSIADAALDLASYVDQVAERGEHFVLTRDHHRLAELRPLPKPLHLAELPSLLATLPHLSEQEAKSFADDLAAGRAELSVSKLSDPWPS